MKRYILSILALLACAFVHVNAENYMVVSCTNGSIVGYPVSQVHDVIYDDAEDAVTIHFTEPSGKELTRLYVTGEVTEIRFATEQEYDEELKTIERNALIALYNATDGEHWNNKTNWCSDAPVNEWYGVYCEGEKGHVIGISMVWNNLSGSLPVEIGNMSQLRGINLEGNTNLNGKIPDEFGDLVLLTEANLMYCGALSNHESSIFRLPNLDVLRCGLDSIPQSIGNMTSIRELCIEFLHGSLPEGIGNLSNLETLYLFYVGQSTQEDLVFPSYISNLTELRNLSLSGTEQNYGFVGSLPENIGNLTQLETFGCTNSHLTGHIPASIANCKKLSQLDLHENSLSGSIPAELFTLPSLFRCDLHGNQLSGTLPPQFANMMNPAEMWSVEMSREPALINNSLYGSIPEAVYTHPEWHKYWPSVMSGNFFDRNVYLPAPHISGVDVKGQPIDNSVFDEKDFTVLWQWDFILCGDGGEMENSHLTFCIEYIKSLYEEYKDYSFQIIGWGAEADDKDTILRYVKDYELPWRMCCTHPAQQEFTIEGGTHFPFGHGFSVSANALMVVSKTDGVIFCSMVDDGFEAKAKLLLDKRLKGTDSQLYTSTDYSKDRTVDTLQLATKGNGIDVILMGDAFSDRQIADGMYDAVMQRMADAFFSEEPYKSHRDYFNVFVVYAVSENEGYGENKLTAFEGWHSWGTNVGGSDAKCFSYILPVVGEERIDETLVMIAMDTVLYAGTCYMYQRSMLGDHGRGTGIAYFPLGTDEEMFRELVCHEAGGHGFAKLADEYENPETGEIPQELVELIRAYHDYGWYTNVDCTSDPSQVLWAQFLSDERYDGQGLGLFEGGHTFEQGVWRPTEYSIMRYNTGGFNAPSRLAIWYRIMRLAYGDTWQYNFEDFVSYDQVNRTPQAAQRRMKQAATIKPQEFVPLAPPVIIDGDWRSAMKNARQQ